MNNTNKKIKITTIVYLEDPLGNPHNLGHMQEVTVSHASRCGDNLRALSVDVREAVKKMLRQRDNQDCDGCGVLFPSELLYQHGDMDVCDDCNNQIELEEAAITPESLEAGETEPRKKIPEPEPDVMCPSCEVIYPAQEFKDEEVLTKRCLPRGAYQEVLTKRCLPSGESVCAASRSSR